MNRYGVKYLVVGGVAVTLYGIPRMTIDLDIAVDLSRENLERLLRAMESLSMKPHPPVSPEELLNPEKREEWIKEKNMVVFTFENPDKPYEVLDILIDPPIPFEEMFSRKKVLDAEGLSIPIVSIQDLIKMKSLSGRKQDLVDIEILKEIGDA